MGGVTSCVVSKTSLGGEVAIGRRIEMGKSGRVGSAPGARKISLDGDKIFRQRGQNYAPDRDCAVGRVR